MLKKNYLIFIIALYFPIQLDAKVFCNICEHSAKSFGRFGVKRKPNRCCQKCSSIGRQRHLWHFLQTEKSEIFEKQLTLLHWAPDPCIRKKLEQLDNLHYIGGDIEPERWNTSNVVKMDITNIDLPGNSIDVVLCSHVMEHIVDDELAMREVYRILKFNGYALFMVPLFDHSLKKTYEDATIIDPSERLKHFGQSDHVRKYVSCDFEARLVKAGFHVQAFPVKRLPKDLITRYVMADPKELAEKSAADIFLCTKRSII